MRRKRKTKEQAVNDILEDPEARRALARQSHEYFFAFYLHKYVTCGSAPFQKEMFAITEDIDARFVVITAFRGSGKSTIMSLSYPLWAIVGVQQKKFVVIVTQTQRQALILMRHIKDEVEHNDLLIADLGPFNEGDGEWKNNAIFLPKVNAKIMVVSIDQTIRSMRHGPQRPDLLIADDIENLASVTTLEGRDKAFEQLMAEFVSATDILEKRVIVVGNLLHDDSVMMRLKRKIESGDLDGIYREYPLQDPDGNCLWPQKFKSPADINRIRKSVVSEAAFEREFNLKIITDEDKVIWREWIHYWPAPPSPETIRKVATGVDLAISEKETADYTAMVSAYVCGTGDEFKIYILPYVVNKRLGFRAMIDEAKSLSQRLGNNRHMTQMYVEDVAFQRAAIEELKAQGVPAEGVQIMGQDKRARLMSISHLVQSGQILFAPQGNEMLIAQLTGFGRERHDDLADAFSLLINSVMEMRVGGISLADLADVNESLRKYPRNPYLPDHSSDYGSEDILNMQF